MAVKNVIEGALSASCPASILQFHKNASIICDEDYSGGKKRIKSFHPKYNQLLIRIFNKIVH